VFSIIDEVDAKLNTWFERKYRWLPKHALAASNYEEWREIIDAFIDGYMTCFWNEDEIDDWWGF
jgi:hypothetical protein